MDGFRFYLDHDSPRDKRQRKHNGNVIAVATDPAQSWVDCLPGQKARRLTECIGPVFNHPNSSVAGSAVASEYLRTQCKRIGEAEARRIHPALFERLDGE